MLDKSKLNQAISEMKVNDKARAFDLIIEAYEELGESESLSKKVEETISWCASWFGK